MSDLQALTLYFLAVFTAGSALIFPYFIEHVSITQYFSEAIVYATGIYLILLAVYIRRFWGANAPQPPAPVAPFPHVEAFSRSAFQVAAMILFFLCDEPLKSITSASVPAICIVSYLHLLILLAILRVKNDYGVSDGLLAASFALLYPLATTWTAKVALFIGAVILSGLKNLQFRETANQNPNPNPPIP